MIQPFQITYPIVIAGNKVTKQSHINLPPPIPRKSCLACYPIAPCGIHPEDFILRESQSEGGGHLTPLIPLSAGGEGEIKKEGFAPLLDTPSRFLPVRAVMGNFYV